MEKRKPLALLHLQGVGLCLAFFLVLFAGQAQAQEQIRDTMWVVDKMELIKELRYKYPDSSLALCDDVIRVSTEMQYGNGIWLGYNGKALGLQRKRDFEKAIFNYEKAIEVADQIPNLNKKAASNLNLSSLYNAMGDYPKSAEYANRCLEIAKDNEWPRGISGAYLNLALIYKTQGDSASTVKYYLKALKINEENEFMRGRGNILHNLASLFLEANNLDSAEKYLGLGIQHADSNDNPYLNNRIRTLQTVYLFKTKQYPAAEEMASRAAQAFKDSNDEEGLAGLYIYIGFGLKSMGELDRALAYGLKATEMGESFGGLEFVKSAKKLVSNIYEAQGDYKKALEYRVAFYQAQDSLKDLNFYADLNKLRLEKEAETKEKELSQLSLEVEQSKNSERILFGALGLAVLLALFFIYRQRVNRRQNQLLREKQKIVQASLQEKETLLAEVHHRVKNNLQLIYNLLDLQSRDLQDEKARNAVISSRNRVASMALVHQKLYREDDLSSVDVHSYLQALLVDLNNSLPHTGDIHFHLDCEALKLDLNSSIPIGLVVNELVTNAIKHAFTGRKHGNVWIRLHRSGSDLILEVQDDGIGIDPKDLQRSFGMSLIRSLSRQLKAAVSIESDKGTLAVLRVTKYTEIS